MPKAPRTLEVNYGGFEVKSSLDRDIDELVSFGEGQNDGFFEFSFIISKSTEAAFIAEANAVETAFRTPRLRLQVKFASGNFLDFDPAASVNTGFNHAPRITKQQDIADSNKSRRYSVRIEFELPADVHGTAGRRDSRVDVSFSPAEKRQLTITGSYTALEFPGSGSARAQYLSAIGAYVATITTALTGTWELVDESQEADDTDKVLDFRRVYDEILNNQSTVGTPDDAEIFKHDVSFSKARPAPGDTSEASRLLEVQVRWNAFIKKGVDPFTKYTSALKEFLVNEAISQFGLSNVALVAETPTVSLADNRLSVTMTLLSPTGESSRIEFRKTVEVSDDIGNVLVPAWTGDKLSYHIFQGHEQVVCTVTKVERLLAGAVAAAGAGAGGGAVGGGAGGGGGQVVQFGIGGGPGAGGAAAAAADCPAVAGAIWVPLVPRTSETPIRIGTPARFIDVIDRTTVQVFQLAKPIDIVPLGTPTIPA